MAVTAGRLITHLEAETSNFDARMTAAATTVERFARPQVIAARAATQLRVGMQQLANQAFATSGPVANLASGVLGLFGGATAITIAATAGAIALAVRAMGSEAREAAKRIADLHRQWVQLMAARGAGVGLQGRLAGVGGEAGLLEQQTALSDRQARASGFLDSPIGKLFGVLFAGHAEKMRQETAKGAEELSLLNMLIAAIRADLDEWRKGLKEADAMKDLAAASENFTATVNEFMAGVDFARIPGAALDSIPSGIAQGTIPTASVNATLNAAANADFNFVIERLNAIQALEIERAKFLAVLGNAEKMATLDTMGLGGAATILAKQMADAADQVEKKAMQMQAAIIGAVAGAIAAIVSGGGPGGILMGLGGIVGLLPGGQVAGAVIAGLGGIITAADARRSREDRENAQSIVHAIEEKEDEGILVIRSGFEGDVAMEDQLARTIERLTDRRVIVRRAA